MRTVAKPKALDSGPGELCVGQEVVSKAGFRGMPRSTAHAFGSLAPRPQVAPSVLLRNAEAINFNTKGLPCAKRAA